MAVTVATVINNPNLKQFSVIATADADVAATIPHGFGAAPAVVILTPIGAPAQLSLWVQNVVDATNITLIATAAVGSGAAPIQLLVTALRPHTIFQ